MPDRHNEDVDRGSSAGTGLAPPVDGAVEVFTEREDEGGSIRISESVIASVVRKYTLEVPGVIAFTGDALVDGLTDMLRRRRHLGAIALSGMHGECVDIAVTLAMEFGVIIPDVAGQVQQAIRSGVEDLTGKRVGKVDVIVEELRERPPEPEPTPADAPAEPTT